MDKSIPSYKGNEIKDGKDLVADNKLTYLEGNGHFLTEFLRNKLGRDPKVCFFGD